MLKAKGAAGLEVQHLGFQPTFLMELEGLGQHPLMAMKRCPLHQNVFRLRVCLSLCLSKIMVSTWWLSIMFLFFPSCSSESQTNMCKYIEIWGSPIDRKVESSSRIVINIDKFRKSILFLGHFFVHTQRDLHVSPSDLSVKNGTEVAMGPSD